MVLLKNDGVLPLKSVKRIAVVGPLADQTAVLLGNYNGTPTHTVSVLEGMKAEFPNAKITYVPGTQFLSNQGNPVPASVLTTPEGKPGLKAEYGSGMRFRWRKPPPITSRVESGVDLNENTLPAGAKGKPELSVEWTGFLNPNADRRLSGRHEGGWLRARFGRRQASRADVRRRHESRPGSSGEGTSGETERGVWADAETARPEAQLIWAPVNNAPDPAAVAAAKNADVVVAVVGITSRLEGEEMPVDQPGFAGGDRTNLDMPQPEEDLVQAVAATGKPLVVVLMNGSALGVNWEKAHANAIVEAWYSGEEGGAAIAETLSGKNNPAGRLPVTFYKDVHQLPHFEDYSMKGRTYRYFEGEPLWPFGYGLSYTQFATAISRCRPRRSTPDDPLDASVTVTNTGKVAGDEVVQLYLKFPDVPGAPIRALRGFQRVHLEPGASQKVDFHLNSRDLSMVTDLGDSSWPRASTPFRLAAANLIPEFRQSTATSR